MGSTTASGRCAGTWEAAVGIKADLIVHLALFGIAQNVIRFLHVLEAVFGGLVAGVEVGVVLAREFPVGLPDVIFDALRATLSVW
jgi:hypothetical protein